MTTINANYHVENSVREYIVEYLHVTAKTHCFKGMRVLAGSKMEAFEKCPKMTKTGRVKLVGDVLSNLKEVTNFGGSLKSDRGCVLF